MKLKLWLDNIKIAYKFTQNLKKKKKKKNCP